MSVKDKVSVSDTLSIKIIRGNGSVEEIMKKPVKITEEFLRHLLKEE